MISFFKVILHAWIHQIVSLISSIIGWSRFCPYNYMIQETFIFSSLISLSSPSCMNSLQLTVATTSAVCFSNGRKRVRKQEIIIEIVLFTLYNVVLKLYTMFMYWSSKVVQFSNFQHHTCKKRKILDGYYSSQAILTAITEHSWRLKLFLQLVNSFFFDFPANVVSMTKSDVSFINLSSHLRYSVSLFLTNFLYFI